MLSWAETKIAIDMHMQNSYTENETNRNEQHPLLLHKIIRAKFLNDLTGGMLYFVYAAAPTAIYSAIFNFSIQMNECRRFQITWVTNNYSPISCIPPLTRTLV